MSITPLIMCCCCCCCYSSYLVEGVPDDLDVHLVEVPLADAADEVGRQGRVYQDGVVQVLGTVGDVDQLQLREVAQLVALWQQFTHRSVMQHPRDDQHYVVDHVPVRDVVQKRRQRRHCLLSTHKNQNK